MLVIIRPEQTGPWYYLIMKKLQPFGIHVLFIWIAKRYKQNKLKYRHVTLKISHLCITLVYLIFLDTATICSKFINIWFVYLWSRESWWRINISYLRLSIKLSLILKLIWFNVHLFYCPWLISLISPHHRLIELSPAKLCAKQNKFFFALRVVSKFPVGTHNLLIMWVVLWSFFSPRTAWIKFLWAFLWVTLLICPSFKWEKLHIFILLVLEQIP